MPADQVAQSTTQKLIKPLPWDKRDPAIANIKGDTAYTLDNLANLFGLLKGGVHKDHKIIWPDSANELSVGVAVRPISNSGLIYKEGPIIRLSVEGETWLANRDPEYLISVIHRNIRYVGEMLNELRSNPLANPALLRIACEKYGFGWSTSSPVFCRTKWLQAAGLVDSFSHKVHLTERGRSFLSRIEIYEPQDESSSPADLRPAPQIIQEGIERVGRDQRSRSRAASANIPGVDDEGGQVAALQAILQSCAAPIDDQALIKKCTDIFHTTPVVADKAVRSLSLIGLIQRVSSTELGATKAGLAWVGSDYPVDLARIVHANIWFFAEIIQELLSSGRLTFTEILEQCGKYSSQGYYEPLKRGGLTARIALLESVGLITTASHHCYRATPLGVAFYRSVPCLEPEAPDAPSTAEAEAVSLDDSAGEEVVIARDRTLSDDDLADQLAEKLIHSARRSEKSVDLELAAVEALNYLGLSASHIGGNDGPDGIAQTRPGTLGSTLTIEAKSAASGVVPEEQAKPATLAHHRDQYEAESTIYIGPGFEKRLLDILDNDERVAVVSTTVIAEAVRRQVQSALTPEELGPLVDPNLNEVERRGRLLVKWKAKEEWSLCLRGLIEILSREAESPMSDETEGLSGVGWLDPTAIRRSLRDFLDQETSRDVIQEVLDFLSSPAVAILEEENEKYRLQVPRHSVPRHFSYLGARWRVGEQLLRAESSLRKS